MPERVLISGGSGLIGRALTKHLLSEGYRVAWLSRRKSSEPFPVFLWDPQQDQLDAAALDYAEHIIHLSGESIAGEQWSEKRKQQIIDSRVVPGRFLAKQLSRYSLKPKTMLAASAVGYYGMVSGEKIYTESDSPAKDFFGSTCDAWENELTKLGSGAHRHVIFRLGVVLATEGGFLPKVSGPVKWFAGSAFGSGRQYIPWVHLQDVCKMFSAALRSDRFSGIYNAVATEHSTNRHMIETIAGVLNKPVILPAVPAFALKLMLGEMAGMILEGSRVSNKKLIDAGFSFDYPYLEMALRNLLKRD